MMRIPFRIPQRQLDRVSISTHDAILDIGKISRCSYSHKNKHISSIDCLECQLQLQETGYVRQLRRQEGVGERF